MKIRLTFSLLALVMLMVTSCKKDDPVKTPKDYLTGRDCWKLVKFETKDSTGAFVDASALFIGTEACDIDDCNKFSADGKYEQNEGATKCDPSDTQVYTTGTWTLSSDSKKLTWVVDGETNEMDIQALTATDLIVSGSFSGLGLPISVRLSFK